MQLPIIPLRRLGVTMWLDSLRGLLFISALQLLMDAIRKQTVLVLIPQIQIQLFVQVSPVLQQIYKKVRL